MIQKVIDYFKIGCSHLFPWLVDQRVGGISPFLEVWLIDGKYHLNTKKANYSFGSLHSVFRTVFDKHNIKDRKTNDVLMLGFGSGSVASILKEEYGKVCSITAIEKDPVVIELGYKYFNLARFQKLNLLNEDAYEYVQKSNNKFDLIVVDLFIDLDVPACFGDEIFLVSLKKLLTEDGILFFNKIAHTEESAHETEMIEAQLKSLFGKVEIEKMNFADTRNYVFVCSL